MKKISFNKFVSLNIAILYSLLFLSLIVMKGFGGDFSLHGFNIIFSGELREALILANAVLFPVILVIFILSVIGSIVTAMRSEDPCKNQYYRGFSILNSFCFMIILVFSSLFMITLSNGEMLVDLISPQLPIGLIVILFLTVYNIAELHSFMSVLDLVASIQKKLVHNKKFKLAYIGFLILLFEKILTTSTQFFGARGINILLGSNNTTLNLTTKGNVYFQICTVLVILAFVLNYVIKNTELLRVVNIASITLSVILVIVTVFIARDNNIVETYNSPMLSIPAISYILYCGYVIYYDLVKNKKAAV